MVVKVRIQIAEGNAFLHRLKLLQIRWNYMPICQIVKAETGARGQERRRKGNHRTATENTERNS
jgi:hypothetical protein